MRQGVGQGRVLSAWMFLVYIDGLIHNLDVIKRGLIIGDVHVPAVLLADDTTIVSCTQGGAQSALDVVHQYACKWRLSYNATKSSILVYTGSYRRQSECNLKLHRVTLPVKESTIYAGSIMSTKRESERTTKACAKVKRTIGSLRDIGLKAGGLNPVSCVEIWRRVILPGALYACELWANILPSEFQKLELLQRYFARSVQNFHQRSSVDVTTQTLGLWTMEGTINKSKLIYLGRLCRSRADQFIKTLFYLRLSQYLNNKVSDRSVIHDLFAIAKKYDVFHFITEYVNEGHFPHKVIWKRIVNTSVAEYESIKWTERVSIRTDLNRFHAIHERLVPHRLWNMCDLFNMCSRPLFALVKLGILPITAGVCLICDTECDDIVLHQLINCVNLAAQRNILYEKLFDHLCIDQYVKIEDCVDNETRLITLLGGITPLVHDMSLDTWAMFIKTVAKEISSWNLQSILYL